MSTATTAVLFLALIGVTATLAMESSDNDSVFVHPRPRAFMVVSHDEETGTSKGNAVFNNNNNNRNRNTDNEGDYDYNVASRLSSRRRAAAVNRRRSSFRSGGVVDATNSTTCADAVSINLSADPAHLTSVTFAYDSGAKGAFFKFNATQDDTCVDFVLTIKDAAGMAVNASEAVVSVSLLQEPACPSVNDTNAAVFSWDANKKGSFAAGRTSNGAGDDPKVNSGEAFLGFFAEGNPALDGAIVEVSMEQLECGSPSHATCPAEFVTIRANPTFPEVTVLDANVKGGAAGKDAWSVFQYTSVYPDTCLDFVAEAEDIAGATSIEVCTNLDCPSTNCTGRTVKVDFEKVGSTVHARTPVGVPENAGAFFGVHALGSHTAAETFRFHIEQLPCGSNSSVTCPAPFKAIPRKSSSQYTQLVVDEIPTHPSWHRNTFKPLYTETCISMFAYVAEELVGNVTVDVCTSDLCPISGECSKDRVVKKVYGADSHGKLAAFNTVALADVRDTSAFFSFSVSSSSPNETVDGFALYAAQYDCSMAPSPTASPSEPSPSPSPILPTCPGAVKESDIDGGYSNEFKVGSKNGFLLETEAHYADTCVAVEAELTAAAKKFFVIGADAEHAVISACWSDTVCPSKEGGAAACAEAGRTVSKKVNLGEKVNFKVESANVKDSHVGYLKLTASNVTKGISADDIFKFTVKPFKCEPEAPVCPNSIMTIISDKAPGTRFPLMHKKGDWTTYEFEPSYDDTCLAFTVSSSIKKNADKMPSSSSSSSSIAFAEDASTAHPVVQSGAVGVRCWDTSSLVTDYCRGVTPSKICSAVDPTPELAALTAQAHASTKAFAHVVCGSDSEETYRRSMCPNDPSKAHVCDGAVSKEEFCKGGFPSCSEDGKCSLRPYSECFPCFDRAMCNSLVNKIFASN